MFFDLEDYRTTLRYIKDQTGLWNPTAAELLQTAGQYFGDPEDEFTTCRATRDFLIRSASEYATAISRNYSNGIAGLALAKFEEIMQAFEDLAPSWKAFWSAFKCFAFYGQGHVDGDIFTDNNGETYVFTIMTQAIYDNYYTGLSNFMTKVKELIELGGDYTI